jgi:hypothetical protein
MRNPKSNTSEVSMPESIMTIEFWVALLTLLGVGKLIEVSYNNFINRKANRLRYNADNLNFMVRRMELMEREIERHKVDLRELRNEMDCIKRDYERLNKVLYDVTFVVEEHAGEDVVRRIREIPGVPTIHRGV